MNDAAHTHHGRELISFRIGAQEFCVDIMAVREIRGWTAATALPQSPSYVRGVINLRGAVLPIVDLPNRLGYGVSEPTARHVIIVAQIGTQFVGLLVDAVSDVLDVNGDAMRPAPDFGSAVDTRFIEGVFETRERLAVALNLEQLLQDAEVSMLPLAA